MKVRTLNYVLGVVLAGGAYLMSGCNYDDGEQKIRDYMAQRGDTKGQLDSMLNKTWRENPVQRVAARQSALDSMVYRDIFYQTQLAKDSSAVAEFNKISTEIKMEELVTDIHNFESMNQPYMIEKRALNILNNKFKNSSINRVDSIQKELLSSKKTIYSMTKDFQYIFDQYLYLSFFEKHRLISDASFAKKLSEAVTRTAP